MPWLGPACQAVLLVLLVWLPGLWLGSRRVGPSAVPVLTWAAVVCLIGAMAGLIPAVVATARRASWLAQALLAGGVVRMLVTLFGATLVYVLVLGRTRPVFFGLAVAAFYLVLLAWETATAVRMIKAHYKNEICISRPGNSGLPQGQEGTGR